MKMWRQGDVLIVEMDKLPENKMLKRIPDGVLLYGEATGHAHRVVGAGVFDNNRGERIIMAPMGPFKVVHEEHDTIEIPEGYYRIVRQREFDEKQIRYVSD